MVLKGDIEVRCRRLLIWICDAEGIEILKGAACSGHIHIEYVPKQCTLVQF